MEMQNRHLQLSYTPVEEGDIVYGVILLVRDVTEEVDAEKLRSEFIANVSHELKTPMVMLSGYSEALLDDIVTEPRGDKGNDRNHQRRVRPDEHHGQ